MATETLQTCATCEIHAEAVFRVEGMDCREEVVILERRLKPLPGLEDLSADLIGQKLHVKYDAALLTTSAMVEAVGDAGLRMWLEHDEPIADDRSDRRGVLSLVSGSSLGVGAAATALGMSSLATPFFLLATAAGAIHPARRAWTAIRAGALDINVLMTLAVGGALVLRDYFEAASVVFLFAVAQWLEVRTMARARQAIRALVDLAPREALVSTEGRLERVPVELVTVGQILVIRPGEKIPLDGLVVSGSSEINESPMTGESLPVAKTVGREVFAGTINGRGALDVRVTRRVRDTRLARVIHLVETAQASRAPLQSFVERFAARYTPAVLALALAVAIGPWLAGAEMPGQWVYRGLVLLVIACPCALVVSTPVSFVAALSAAARHGVLVKGGASLERLAATRIVAFDKTGTLTKGMLAVVGVAVAKGRNEAELVRLAASVEARDNHPVARAISAYAHANGMSLLPVTAFRATSGVGVEGMVEGRLVSLTSDRDGVAQTVLDSAFQDHLRRLERDGRAIVIVRVDGQIAGAFALADELRDSARDALDLLRSGGMVRTVMLTGDALPIAQAVAARVGVDEFHAELLPEDKHALIQRLSSTGPVLMVGDGINDAPALAAANVGVAMGAIGSDVALEAADIALMSDELMKLPYMLRLARATVRNVRTNVAISLALKLAFLGAAVAGMATLWMAVLADTGATIIVVANALRLLRQR